MHNFPDGISVTWWCSFCRAEPAEGDATIIEDGQNISLPIGVNCLQSAAEAGKLDVVDN